MPDDNRHSPPAVRTKTTGGKIVTIEEANALVPRLATLVGKQIERGSDIEERLHRLHRAGKLKHDERAGGLAVHLRVDPSDSDAVQALKRELTKLVNAYEEGWNEVQRLGAVVKDPRVGIIDFYGYVDGKLVCLCWRYGEDAVAHYHGLDAGFAGRRPLEGGARDRTLN